MCYVYDVCSICVSIRVTRAGYTLCVHMHVSLCVGEYVRTAWLLEFSPPQNVTPGRLHVGAVATIRPLFHDFSQGPAMLTLHLGQQNRPVRPWTVSPSGPRLLW